jgi:hypothetical protein
VAAVAAVAAVFLIFGFGGQQKNSLFEDIQDSLYMLLMNRFCVYFCAEHHRF